MQEKYLIGEIAKIKNIDSQTLRYYDRMGILSPAIIDHENGYRYYSREQFIEVDRIKFYKKIGLSLSEISEFKSIDNVDQVLDVLKNRKRKIDDQISKMQSTSDDIRDIINNIKDSLPIVDENSVVINIKDEESIYGVVEDCHDIRGWYEVEKCINRIMNKYPSYSDIGHNYGLIMIHDWDFINTSHIGSIKRIILPVKEYQQVDDFIEEYTIGRCIVVHYKGSIINYTDLTKGIIEYIDKHNLEPLGEVLIIPIINSFIISDKSKGVFKIVIPIK